MTVRILTISFFIDFDKKCHVTPLRDRYVYKKKERESHISCSSRDLRPTTAHPCRRATKTSRRYENIRPHLRTQLLRRWSSLTVYSYPWASFAAISSAWVLKVVVSSRLRQAQITPFHICLPTRNVWPLWSYPESAWDWVQSYIISLFYQNIVPIW